MEKNANEDITAAGVGDIPDCTAIGPDGFMDLSLKFEAQEVIRAIEASLGRKVCDNEVVNITLTGSLKEEFGKTPIQGKDVLVILDKRNK